MSSSRRKHPIIGEWKHRSSVVLLQPTSLKLASVGRFSCYDNSVNTTFCEKVGKFKYNAIFLWMQIIVSTIYCKSIILSYNGETSRPNRKNK